MAKKLMSMNKAGPADQLPAEIPDVSAPSMKSQQPKKAKTKWLLALCCAGAQEAVSQDVKKRSSEESLLEAYFALQGISTSEAVDCVNLEVPKSWSPTAVHWQNGENEEGTTVQDLPGLISFIGTKYPGITSSLIYQSLLLEEYMRPRPHCERVLETIIFSDLNGDYDTDTDEIKRQKLFRMSCEAFQLEASKTVSNIMSETAEISKASDLAGMSSDQSKLECTSSAPNSSAPNSSAQHVDVVLEKKTFKRGFGLPKLLKLKFKQRKNRASAHTEDWTPDKNIPNVSQRVSPTPADEPSTSTRTVPEPKRKSLITRLRNAFSKLCRK